MNTKFSDKRTFEKRLVFKWGCLVAVNALVPWFLAVGAGYDSLSDTVAILLGLVCIVIVLVKIDHNWKTRGKTRYRQALLTGAVIKIGAQFLLISDILIGGISLLISMHFIENIHPLGVLLTTILVGTGNFFLCYVGGLIVVSIYKSLPPVARRIQLREDIINLTNQLEKQGRLSLLRANHTILHRHWMDKNATFLLTIFPDQDWKLKNQIITILQRALRLWPPVLSLSMQRQVKEAFITVLKNPEEDLKVRVKAATVLGKMTDISLIKPFLPILSESHEYLHKHATAALQSGCSLVHVVVFGNNAVSEDPGWDHRHTLFNPDVSRLTVPMRNLMAIVIDAKSCDLRLVEAFARYIRTYIGESYLKRQVTAHIYDDLRLVPLGFWSPFSVCGYVDIYITNITVVVLGAPTSPRYACQSSLYNPDVVELTLPMSNLKQVSIYPETSDLRRLEEFCTYAVNYIGQKYLKRHVDVHIYGDPKRLHPNVRNTFNNLCRDVYVHEREE